MNRLHLLAVLAFLLPAVALATGPQLYLLREAVEVRAAPSPSAPAIGELPRGGPGVAVLEPDESGAWGHVEWEGRAGWVPMQSLRRAFQDGPELFRVTGVAADDSLNVRNDPSPSADDIGDLAPGATVEVLAADPQGRWGRIVHQGGNGWVSLAYLAPIEPERVAGSEVPVGLHCAGTEPFWSVLVGTDSLTYDDPEAASRPLPITLATAASGRRGFPALLRAAGEGTVQHLIVRPAACSDGMSDITYGWEAELIEGERFMTGCCRIDDAR